MPVAAAYFLPVSVFVAVTATPGSGTPPALPTVPAMTVPRTVPPCGCGAVDGAEACGAEADGVAGSAADCVGCVAGTGGCVAAGADPGVCAPIENRPAMHTTMHTTVLTILALNLTQSSFQKLCGMHLCVASAVRPWQSPLSPEPTSAIAEGTAAYRCPAFPSPMFRSPSLLSYR